MLRSLILSTAAAALMGGAAAAQQATPPAQSAPAGQAPAAPAPAEQAPAAEAPAAEAPAQAPAAEVPAAGAEAPAADGSTADPAAGLAQEVPLEAAPAEGAPEASLADAPADQPTAATETENAHPADDHGEGHVEDYAFSFEGPFGAFDQHQLQRGLQVYTEICSACHGLRYVPIRTLADETGPGMPEDQVRAYAANLEVFDPMLGDNGDFRTATPNDHFPQSSLEGSPDLSLMAKARAGFHGPYGLGLAQLFKGIGGPEYIASLLTGYTGETKEEAGTTFYENTAFPGGWIAMPPPLLGDDVTYADGHSADLEHEAQDVAAFLMWTAEPKLMQRKQAGFIAVVMLGLLSVLLYLTNKRIWAPIKYARRETAAE